MRNYKYFWSLVPGAFVIFGNCMGGWWGISNFIFSLGLLAVVEWFFPEDKKNETDKSSLVPDFILVLHVFMQSAALLSLIIAIQQNHFTPVQCFWAIVSTGVHSGTSAIVVAHEMIHRKALHWQLMGKYLLLTAGNIYFFVEHLRVHHKHVGTAADPATARMNESLYSFYLRTSVQQISGAWKMETERIRQSSQSLFHHYGFISIVLLAVILVVIWLTIGFIGVIAFAGQAVVANFLLEYTNYIEHYGLTRLTGERVTEVHSWQSDKVISRFFLVDLSRHSDHHYYASKPFHQLSSYANSPVLPGGYASAIYLALIPPLWFRVMNPRIADFKSLHGV